MATRGRLFDLRPPWREGKRRPQGTPVIRDLDTNGSRVEKGGQSDVRFVDRRLELAEVRTERRTTPRAAFVFWWYPKVPPRTREIYTIVEEENGASGNGLKRK